ncbi:Fic family protein [Austwickia sp. TVS 96-490-7B]|uniref:Fic family protein n=1 Tax=Austwickia sp. TVS 96-490-7B TaxID=2830843 RepID=UPI001C58D7F8|nr:Fic family protein [Austwickia sp. TVS 96-490-7B]
MRAADFATTMFGAPTRQPGNRWSFDYYLPGPIPRDLPLNTPLVTALSDADAALGQLQGLGTLIQEPGALIGPYLRREALASTRIEGTQASLSEVLQAELDDQPQTQDVVEVQRYLEATSLAHQLLKELPITQRLILQVHRELLRDVRGEERRPGEFRASPVWIGGAGATPETAAFVPPLPDHLPELLTDWENFVNDDGRAYPALIQAALMHYQFETIHPFLDGNGRIGRLLINLQLMARGRLSDPLLYLSSYFETHRHDYYRNLQGVRETGNIDGWLHFFLGAVKEQAGDAVARARALIELREELRAQAASRPKSSLPRLVDMIVRNPYVTVRSVENAIDLTNQGARHVIRAAVELGWLESLGSYGRGGREHWLAPRVLEILETPMAYDSTKDVDR